MQHNGDGGRLECRRPFNGQINRLWRFRLNPIA
jgi:hypothetical protein